MQTEYPTIKSSSRGTTRFRVALTVLLFSLFTLSTLGFAQSPSNIFVTGATPASTNSNYYGATDYSVAYASQTYNYNSTSANTGTTAAPDYCQTPANQSRPECQGTVNNNYYTNTNTYTNTSVPSYCSNAANANRPECQSGYTATQTANQVTTTGQYPDYCQTPANQSRSECQGSSFQTTTANTASATTYPDYCYQSQYSTRTECAALYGITSTQATTYPDYCYQSQYSTRTECVGLYSTPVATSPVIVTTPISQTTPNYCVYPEYQFRPECQTQVNPVTILNPTTTTQYPAYCANPANQFLVACQPSNTVTPTTTTSNYPTYCQTPANQNRPECQGSVTTPTVSTVTPQPCQAGIYNPNCVNTTVTRPCIVGIYDPLCTPTTTTTVPTATTIPAAPVAPINCPQGTGGENCVDSGDFALPVPPAPLNCQQNSLNNPQAIRDFCSAIYFTHAGAYTNNSAVPTIRRFQEFSFLLRSPYAGYAYIFSRSIDGSIQSLLPNPQIPQPVNVNLYSQVHIPTDVNTFGNNYSFTMNQPISEIFYVVLTQRPPSNTFANIRNDQELQNVLLNLGLVNGIYHGVAGSPVQIIN